MARATVEMVGAEFKERVRYVGLSWLPGRELVEKALDDRVKIDPRGHIMVLDTFCPWKEHL